MWTKETRLVWLASAGVLLASVAARAQSAEAESLFEDGMKLIAQGKLAEACAAFEASNRVEARAGTLIQVGKCRESNHQLASAWSAYKDALTRVKDPKKRVFATEKIAELEPKLSYLTLRVATRIEGLQVTRNGQPIDPGEWDRAVATDGGHYAIAAHAAHHRDWQLEVDVPESAGTIVVDIPKLDDEALAIAPASQPVAVVAAPAVRETSAPPSAWTGKRKAAAVAAGVALIGATGGAVLGVLSNHAQDDANRLCPQKLCANSGDATTATTDIHTAQSRALQANIAFGVAAAAVIGAGVLWLSGAPEHAHGVAIAPAVAPGTASLTITGWF